MSDRKRDRIRTDTKHPKPSPNRRDTKRLQQESKEKETNKKDQEMKNAQEKAVRPQAKDVVMTEPPILPKDKDESVSDLSKKFEATKTDWKALTQENGSRGWLVGKIPSHTEHWLQLSESKQKTVNGFLKEDLSNTAKWPLSLKDGLKDIKFFYQIDEKKTFAKTLSSSMIADINKMAERSYNKAFKTVLDMSQTDITELPSAVLKKNGMIFLKHSTLSELWIASIDIFGDTRNSNPVAIVFKKSQAIIPVTTAWLAQKPLNTESFNSETIFSEGTRAHDWCQKVKIRLLTGNNWLIVFRAAANKQEKLTVNEQLALDLAKKLALTDPSVLTGWNGDDLHENDISSAWAAAYTLFGCAWKSGVKFGDSPAPKGTTHPEPKSSMKTPKFAGQPTTDPTTEATSPNPISPLTNPYYVEKLPPAPPKSATKIKVWKEVTYLKAKLSTYWDRDTTTYGQAMTKMLNKWGTLLDVLFARDPSGTVVSAWSQTDLRTPPLNRDSKKPITKESVSRIYSDEFYMSQRPGTQFIRFRLGHKKPISYYLESDTVQNSLEELGLAIFLDKIQDSNVSIAGWGAGPVLGRNSLNDIEDMLKSHPLVTANKINGIELRVQQVRLHKGAWIKGEPRPLAIHFYVRSRDAAQARRTFNSIYPSKPKSDYPGGVQWRFVTNVMDPYFPKTPNSVRKSRNLRNKQQQFQKETRSTATITIKNLHYRLPLHPYATLAQILMNWRSARNPRKRLFLHVEQTWEQTEVFYHSSMEKEAETLVPLLPLVLEQEYGPRAWNWFYDTAKDCLGGYEYDLDNHRVTLMEDDINAEVDANWDQSMGEYTGDISDDEDEDEEQGHVILIGDIVLDATDRHRILDDESVATMKSTAEALSRSPKGWTEDPDDKTGTLSTLSTTTKEANIDSMSPQQLQDLMTKASRKLDQLKPPTPPPKDPPETVAPTSEADGKS